MAPRMKNQTSGNKPISLKILADYLGLSPATVSVVLNNVPGRSIPPETRERVRAAARKFNYQPSLLARSLRKQRTFTVGILVPELSDGYHTIVMSGIGDHLMREGYFYFSAHHRHKPDLIEEYPRLMQGRGVEGIIAIDTALLHKLPVPAVAVAGHRKIPGVTNVVLDHKRAAELSLRHLRRFGRPVAQHRGGRAGAAFGNSSGFDRSARTGPHLAGIGVSGRAGVVTETPPFHSNCIFQ